jgi:hypothetical protein
MRLKAPVWNLVSMTSDENNFAEPNASKRFGRMDMFFGILCALAVLAAVGHFVSRGQGRAAFICAGVDYAVVRLRWESGRNLWSWCAIPLILVVQVIVIRSVAFGGEWQPAYSLVPGGLAVYLFDECIIFLVKKGFGNGPK